MSTEIPDEPHPAPTSMARRIVEAGATAAATTAGKLAVLIPVAVLIAIATRQPPQTLFDLLSQVLK